MTHRVDITAKEHPHFFGCWMLENPALCDDLIALFESNADVHKPGIAGGGEVQEAVKKSTDMMITPSELTDAKFQVVSDYIEELMGCFRDYLEQWEFLKTFMPRVHIGTFNIQKYDPGGHFGKLHSERTSLSTLHRTLVWMTYLNDVSDGGETEFPMYGLKFTPERGKTLIWPAEWTHAHRGSVVNSGDKYIITGWMHYPDN